MPIEINFYPLDASVTKEGVVVFGYTQDKKRVAVLDAGYHPHFYASERNFKELKAALEKIHAQPAHVQADGDNSKVILSVENFDNVAREARKHTTVYNADIPLRKRWWVDRKILPLTLTKAIGEPIDKRNFRVDICVKADFLENIDAPLDDAEILAFDFETSSSSSFPDARLDAIISAAVYGNNFKRVITWKRFNNAPDYVDFVDGEEELIEEFVKTVNEQRPHIIVGYGSDNFDMPYLLRRAEKYNLDLDLCWDGDSVAIKRSGNRTARIVGPSYYDLVHFMRRILGLELNNFSLDTVAKKMLGKGKLALLNAKKITEMWSVGLQQDLAILADYNLVDAQLTFELAKKTLPVQLELSKLMGQALHDVNLTTYGTLVEWFIIKNSGQKIPPRPSAKEVAERMRRSYAGGHVVEPKPGLYKNVYAFDFRSLYPSIIVSHNISPETINCDCCGVKGRLEVRDESVWFCSKKTGFVPVLLKDLVERRKRINSILKQTSPSDASFAELMARQHALKYIGAAFYGYLGFAGSRFYSFDCARAVTSLGRKYIQMIIKEAGKFGFKILYGDTDSLFVELQNSSNDDDVSKFLEIVNSVLPEPMELELRSKYVAGLFLEKKSGEGGAKKRYALLTPGNSLILRGLEAIRGDWSELAKKTQKEIINIILSGHDVEKAAEHLRKKIRDVESRKIPVNELAINVKLTRGLDSYATNTPHVVAARMAKEKGYPVQRGFVVSYIRVNGDQKVKLADECKPDEYDTNYYIEHQIIRAVYKIFELFGYGLEKLKAGQTTLEGYDN